MCMNTAFFQLLDRGLYFKNNLKDLDPSYKDGSRSLRLFWTRKKHFIGELHMTDLYFEIILTVNFYIAAENMGKPTLFGRNFTLGRLLTVVIASLLSPSLLHCNVVSLKGDNLGIIFHTAAQKHTVTSN